MGRRCREEDAEEVDEQGEQVLPRAGSAVMVEPPGSGATCLGMEVERANSGGSLYGERAYYLCIKSVRGAVYFNLLRFIEVYYREGVLPGELGLSPRWLVRLA